MRSRLLHTRDIYDVAIQRIQNENEWRSTLTAIAEYWKIDFVESLLIYSQNPRANTIGTFEQWQKANRYIQRGEKSIAVFRDRTDTKLNYYFDITQTYGKSIIPKWRIDFNNAELFVNKYNENNEEKITEFSDLLKKELDKSLVKVYNDGSNLIISSSIFNEKLRKLMGHSALHICAARCGINAETDFSYISEINDPKELIEIGRCASVAAREVLTEIEHAIRRRDYDLQQTSNPNNRHRVRNENGRTALSEAVEQQRSGEPVADGAQSGGRAERNGLEDARGREHLGLERNDIRGDSGQGDGNQAEAYRRVEEVYRTQQRLLDENVTADGDRHDSGPRSDGSNSDVSEEADNGREADGLQGNEELSHQLSINDSDSAVAFEEQSNNEEAVSDEDAAISMPESEQLSFYESTNEVRHNVAPENESLFVGEVNRFTALHDAIMYGSGFQDGKFRIENFYRTKKPSTKDFAEMLKKEYGVGGHCGNGIFVDYDSSGISFRVKDESEFNFKWNEVAKYAAELINDGKYITQENIDDRIRHSEFILRECKPNDLFTRHEISHAKAVLAFYGRTENIYHITRNTYDTDNIDVFTVPKKGSIVRVPLTVCDELQERFKVAGLSPNSKEEIEIFFETDNLNWFKFYIPDKFGNKFNSINARDILHDDEYEIMLNVAAKVVPQMNGEVTAIDEVVAASEATVVEETEKENLDEDYDDYQPQIGDKLELDNGTFRVSEVHTRIDGEIEYELQDLGSVYPIFRCIKESDLFERGFALVEEHKATEIMSEVRHNVAPVEEKETVPLKPAPINFHADNIEYASGAKAKYRDNVNAINKLRQLEQEKRPANPDEQLMLAKYVGWGGLAKAFDDKADDWHNEYTELKALLTPDEYKAAMESTLTAYYTDPRIIKEIYGTLERFGFKGGEILDPSMGTGNFFSVLPESIGDNSKLSGIELDSITGRIAKQLHQKADIKIRGFECTSMDDNKYDVIVGNVPFGNFNIYDKTYKDDYLIHDYFFRKSVDKVKPGGIIAFITSKGTLDKFNDGMRRDIAPMVDFIGAVRLPNNAFKAIAGTEVTTDIIFLKKRENEIDYGYNYPEWTAMDRANIKGNYVNVNGYYTKHPEMICGTMKNVTGQYGQVCECLPTENQDLISDLHNALDKLEAEFTATPTINSVEETEEKNEALEDAPLGTKNFTFVQKDSRLYFCENDKLVPYMAKNAKVENRIKGMCDIMSHLENTINIQLENGTDIELSKAQEQLNNAYDHFVKDYGYLNSAANKIFSDDVRSPLLYSIELEDEEHEKGYKKADIFTKATIRPYKAPTSADNADEALLISLNLKQKVDVEYIAALCNKDCDEVIKELGDKIYQNPAKFFGDQKDGWELAEEYLSGYVKDKLAIATVKATVYPELFSRNVEALKENQPSWLSIESIDFSLGTIYIPPEMYRSFIYDTLNTPNYNRNKLFGNNYVDVNYNKIINEWQVSNKNCDNRSVEVNEQFGTKRISAYEIFEQSLNLKRVEIKDPKTVYNREGKETTTYVINKNETLLARDRQSKLEKAFKDWVLSDEKRVSTIEEIYNSTYNNIKLRTYDGSYIQVKGLSDTVQLRPHQKDVTARIVHSGTALMAHEVGAGKTAAMAASGMYLKNIGAINKALYVVPKPIVGQWGKEFLRFFPSANILVTSEKDFEKSNRQRFLSKIATGNYDAVIMSQSQFEKIPLSLERQEEMFRQKISDISSAMSELEQDKGKRFSVKQMAGKRKSLENKLEKLRADFKKDKFITFEELGCDFLFVDEAHNYKNLAMFTKMNNVSGINTSSNSQRALDMEMKIRYIQEINNGGGVVFATGTPVSNTLSELFVMQHYLQPQRLKEMKIDYFDNWASVFGKTTTALELKPSGDGFRMKTRFASFHNLPELCNIFGEVFDIKKTSELDLKLPELVGGKPEMVICEKSPEQEVQTQIGMERAAAIENKQVTPEEDNMLAVCTYMTKVALDARINNPDAEDYELSKVNQCVNSIIDINENNLRAAQVVFCDTSVPKADGSFSVYKAIKDSLVESRKFKPEEVAFIHDANTDEQRSQMFEKVNNAEIKVIIGSTGKLGTGVNIQQRLIAAHHLDAPYRPADLEQRNGRLIRQGNTNTNVYVKYYSTKGTFDNYRWQLLEKKQRFISQVMSGKPASRSCEDIDEATLNYAEMKAATTENPLIAEKLTVDNEVSRLLLLHSEWTAQQSKLTRDIETGYPEKIQQTEALIVKATQDVETLSKNSLSGFSITINELKYDERAEAGKALNAIAVKYATSEEYRNYDKKTVGTYRGFEIELCNSGGEMALRLRGNRLYQTQFSWNELGAIMKIENLAEKIPLMKSEEERNLESYHKQLKAAIALKAQPFEHSDELAEQLAKQARINTELEFGNSNNTEEQTLVNNDDEDMER